MKKDEDIQVRIRANERLDWKYSPLQPSVAAARRLAYSYYSNPEYIITVNGVEVESRKANKGYFPGRIKQGGLPTLGKKK